MLTLVAALPEGVVGVEAHGKVTADHYEEVLIPVVDAAQRESGDRSVRLRYVIGDEFPHYTAGAVRNDIKLRLGQLRDELDSARAWLTSARLEGARLY